MELLCYTEFVEKRSSPVPAVDIIIELKIPRPILRMGTPPPFEKGGEGGLGIVLIQRKNPPYGWAVPGGFVDYGETLEHAAQREALEETSLHVKLKCQLHSYSDPKRDPRFHTISTVFVAEASGIPQARDDAKEIGIFAEGNMPKPLAFDHKKILQDYFRWKKEGWGIYESFKRR